MLPEGWKSGKLADQLDHIIDYRGTSVPKAKSGIPLITARNVRKGFLDLSTTEYIDPNAEKEWMSRGYPHAGDILFTTEAPLGNIAKFPEHGRFCIGQRVVALRTNKHVLASDFLLYQLLSDKGQDLIDERSSGSTAKGIKTKELKKISILLPPLPEQKKIAAILSTWDRAIEGTEKLLANSQQQKKALMQQLLTGKKRLPGFTGEWKICSLSDVATVQTATSKTQYICENGERFIVDMGSVNRLGNLVCTKSTQHNADLLPKGTLVMPKDDIGGGNIIGRTSYIDRDDLYVLGDHVYALHIGDCDSKFLHFLINSHPINKNLRRRANGTAQLGLGKKDVLRQKIKIPSEFSEQKAIAAVLTTADEEITALESDLSRLSQEKKALMQQLLTGKRRVTVD